MQIDGIYYYLNSYDKTAEVTYGSVEYKGAVIIPSSVTNKSTTYTVTEIGSWAFYECTGLTSVTIPNSVTEIGYGAFRYCI